MKAWLRCFKLGPKTNTCYKKKKKHHEIVKENVFEAIPDLFEMKHPNVWFGFWILQIRVQMKKLWLFDVDATVQSWEVDLYAVMCPLKDLMNNKGWSNGLSFEWMVQWGSWISAVMVFQLPKALWRSFRLQIELHFSLILIFDAKLSNGILFQNSQQF